MQFQPHFTKTITNTWGKKAEDWLHKLPEIISQLTHYWHLNDLSPVSNMSYNYVTCAKTDKSANVVLKICCDKKNILDEYKAIKAFNGNGMVHVLAINQEYNALLLEQAIPGVPLKQHHATDINKTINIYTTHVRQLLSNNINQQDFLHVAQWCDAIDRIRSNKIDKKLIDKATQVKNHLLTTAKHELLCHGDLHLDNILQHEDSWLAIDPKGIIGEMAFEAAAFDFISKSEMNQPRTISEKLFARSQQLASGLKIEHQRLLQWVFVRLMISAQWFIEDNGDPSQAIELAANIEPLI